MPFTVQCRGDAAHRNSSKDLLDNVQLGDAVLLTLRLQGILGFDVARLNAEDEREHSGETRHACHNIEDHTPALHVQESCHLYTLSRHHAVGLQPD